MMIMEIPSLSEFLGYLHFHIIFLAGVMRTACLTPSNRAKEVAELLETEQQWPEFADGALVLWRGPASVDTDGPEETVNNGEDQDPAGKWLPLLLPSKYSPRCPND